MEGFTAYRRWKGRTFEREVTEIGESVWYMKPNIKGKDTFDTLKYLIFVTLSIGY